MENESAKNNPTQGYTAVISQIRDMVLSGKLTAGDRLPPERKLCQQLSVSRSVLRRALQALADRNIIESRQGAGTYLIADSEAFSASDALLDAIHNQSGLLNSILEFRQLIEPQIAALAAERISTLDIEALKKITAEQERAVSEGTATGEFDSAFHRQLVESAGNQVISQVMETIASVVDQTRSPWLQSKDRSLASLKGHRRIIEALESGDPDRAVKAMKEHICDIERHISPEQTTGSIKHTQQ